MKIEVRNRCPESDTYRAARVRSLFNAEVGGRFDLDVDLAIDDADWSLGLVVGPSGSGKSSIGRMLFGADKVYKPDAWPADQPIIDAIGGAGEFNDVTAALSAVGLGSVPSWLRPYGVLSNGERFRADLARIICDAPRQIVIDEFTSVVDRQIARIGALAFQKAWRRTAGQCVLLSCHYDIVDWLEPDWVFDTGTGEFVRGRELHRRPRFELEVFETDWRYWPTFEPHHYLKLPKMIGAKCYVGTVDGELVCHLGVATANRGGEAEARGCRLVVMPEWQGAGIGMRFLNQVCEWQLTGDRAARMPGRKVPTIFHTSHPGLAAALRRDPKWVQVSAKLHGTSKSTSARTMVESGTNKTRGRATAARTSTGAPVINAGYGGHFRAVQGFRYLGAR